MGERGTSLAELAVALGMIAVLGGVCLHALRAYSVESRLLGAGDVFKGQFRRARSIAVRSGVQTAIRFEETPEGICTALYQDGNYNGVLASEIASGVDRRISEPIPLTSGAPGVRVGINPGVPEPPPGHGRLDPSNPIRFGRSRMLSFSPLGTATPGTFFLAGEGFQAAVRVTGGSARVRLMIYRGRRWEER
jgi:hypothetical protein